MLNQPLLYFYRRGNLSVRSLIGVVNKKDVVQDSEYLETLMVAVPKYVTFFRLSTLLLSRYVEGFRDKARRADR